MKLLKTLQIYMLFGILVLLLGCEKEKIVPNNPKIVVTVINPMGKLEADIEIILYQKKDNNENNFIEIKRSNSNDSGIVTFDELEIGEFRIMASEKISSNYIRFTTELNKEYHSILIIIK